eukprot:TRINITY_DN32085_c0_g1_i1.p1 TRINITY_DN32085_c0_g1~~TRINITY_DN32085_c0_g1_i1.p1  ORF type:complete len:4433 (+),score=1274.30 TRINITY_DN32085_c0_g1_i1:67-13299(+)
MSAPDRPPTPTGGGAASLAFAGMKRQRKGSREARDRARSGSQDSHWEIPLEAIEYVDDRGRAEDREDSPRAGSDRGRGQRRRREGSISHRRGLRGPSPVRVKDEKEAAPPLPPTDAPKKQVTVHVSGSIIAIDIQQGRTEAQNRAALQELTQTHAHPLHGLGGSEPVAFTDERGHPVRLVYEHVTPRAVYRADPPPVKHTRIDLYEDSRALSLTFFLSRQNSAKHAGRDGRQESGTSRPYGDELVDRISEHLLQKASPFSWFCITRCGDKENRRWNCMALNPRKTFPYRKRLGHVFLSLLGRSPLAEHTAVGVPAVPDVVLKPESELWKALHGHATKPDLDKEITLSAQVIDQVSKKEWEAGYYQDQVWENYCKEGGYSVDERGRVVRADAARSEWVPMYDEVPHGARASKIYGDKKFTITINELMQLEKSTRIATSYDLPAIFYAEFVKFTTQDKDHQMFFDLRRSLPLIEIGQQHLWQGQREELERLWRERFNKAEAEKERLLIQRQKLLRDLQFADADFSMKIMEGGVPTGEKRDGKDVYINLEDVDFNLDDQCVIAENAALKLKRLGNKEYRRTEDRIATEFREFIERVLATPTKFGFGGRSRGIENSETSALLEAHTTLKMSLTELGTMVCISMKGYFFVDGCGGGFEEEMRRGQKAAGNHNQICEKTPQKIVFLSSCGVDFCDPAATKAEAIKYFKKVTLKSGQTAYRGWKEGAWDGEGGFLERCKRLYRVLFRSCKAQGAKNPSMLSIGLGVFLENVHPDDKERVKEAYFRAQWQLLLEQDWGFQNYFINTAQHGAIAKKTLDDELDKATRNGKKFLRCNVVMHGRDVKFLAVEMAKQKDAYPGPAFLNPSDTASVWLGLMGYFWERGRQNNYVGEEDFCCTSTGILARVGISRAFGDVQRHIAADSDARSPRVTRYEHSAHSRAIKQHLLRTPRTVDDVIDLAKLAATVEDGELARYSLSELLSGDRENRVLQLARNPENCIPILTHLVGGDGVPEFGFLRTVVQVLDMHDRLLDIGSYCGVHPGLSSLHKRTPLHVAAYHGNLDACASLVLLGHPSDICSLQWETVLDCAADTSRKHALRAAACCKLIRASPRMPFEQHSALPRVLDEVILSFTGLPYQPHSDRADPVRLPRHARSSTRGWTKLHWACALGMQSVAEDILDAVLVTRDGVPVWADSGDERSPWETGIRWKKEDRSGRPRNIMAAPLKNSPADRCNLSRFVGRRVTHVVNMKLEEIKKWFHSTDPQVALEKLRQHCSHIVLIFEPSHAASSPDSSPPIPSAKEQSAMCNARDDDGWTPLHWAIARQDVGIMRLLLACGAETELRFEDHLLLGRQQLEGEWAGVDSTSRKAGSHVLEIKPQKQTVAQIFADNKKRWAQQRKGMREEYISHYTGRLLEPGSSFQEVSIEHRIIVRRGDEGRQYRMKRMLLVQPVGSRNTASALEFEWWEREMRLVSTDRKIELRKPRAGDRNDEHAIKERQYTSPLHVCCELAGHLPTYEKMAKLLIRRNDRLLDAVGGPRGEKPFITALVHASLLPFRMANTDGWRGREGERDLITELLSEDPEAPEGPDASEMQKVRRKCIMCIRETIKRPLGPEATQRGWLLRLLESEPFGEEAATQLLLLLSKSSRMEQLARNLILHALHNACACLGSSDSPDGPAGGDTKLVSRVIDFISGLDLHPHIAMWLRLGLGPQASPHTPFPRPLPSVRGLFPGRDATSASPVTSAASPTLPTTTSAPIDLSVSERSEFQYLVEVVPNEEDIFWAEEELRKNNHCDRWLFEKAFHSLCSSSPAVKELVQRTRNAGTVFTVDQLRQAVERRDASGGGGTLVRQIFEKIDEVRKASRIARFDGYEVEAYDMQEALGLLLRNTMKVNETSLLVAVRFERTGVIDVLLRKSAIDYGGRLLTKPVGGAAFVSAKDLLREAINGQRWEAAKRLLPCVQEELHLRGDRCVFEELPSVRRKRTVKSSQQGTIDALYPHPPSFREVQFCFQEKLVPLDHFTQLLKSHTHWKTEPSDDHGSRGKGATEDFRATPFSAGTSPKGRASALRGDDKLDDADKILKFLLHHNTSCCLVEFFERKSASAVDGIREGDNFPFFDFGTGTRNGELFLAVCYQIIQNQQDQGRDLLTRGFKMNEVTFTPEDYPALQWPLHTLMLKGHSLQSEFDIDARHNLPLLRGRDPAEAHAAFMQRRETALEQRRRYIELAVDVCQFINRLVSEEKQQSGMTKVSSELRAFALGIPLSCYSTQTAQSTDLNSTQTGGSAQRQDAGITVDATIKDAMLRRVFPVSSVTPSSTDGDIGREHELKTYRLSSFVDQQGMGLYPIEVAIELHKAEVLRAMLTDEDDNSALGSLRSGAAAGGLRRSDLQLGRDRTDTVVAACYRDQWFPDNDEWRTHNDAGKSKIADTSVLTRRFCTVRRPLLHRALGLLPFPVLTPYQENQRHLLESFRVRNPELVKHAVRYAEGANRDKFTACESCGEHAHKRKYCKLTNNPHQLDPEVLHLRSTEWGSFLSGVYKLVGGRLVNGQRVWRRLDGRYYIFSGTARTSTQQYIGARWYVYTAQDGQLRGAQGFVRSAEEHDGMPPNEMKLWQRASRTRSGSDHRWTTDPQFQITATAYEEVGIPWFPPGCQHLGTGGTWQDQYVPRRVRAKSDLISSGVRYAAHVEEQRREVVRVLLRSVVMRDKWQTSSGIDRVEPTQAELTGCDLRLLPEDASDKDAPQHPVAPVERRLSTLFDRCGLFQSAPLVMDKVHVLISVDMHDSACFEWIVDKAETVGWMKRTASWRLVQEGLRDESLRSVTQDMCLKLGGDELQEADQTLGRLLTAPKGGVLGDSTVLCFELQFSASEGRVADMYHPGQWRDHTFDHWCEVPHISVIAERKEGVMPCTHLAPHQWCRSRVIMQNHWSCCGALEQQDPGCLRRGATTYELLQISGTMSEDSLREPTSAETPRARNGGHLQTAGLATCQSRFDDTLRGSGFHNFESLVRRDESVRWHRERDAQGSGELSKLRHRWKRDMNVFGLSMLLQRAPWVLTDNDLRKRLFSCIEAHPSDCGQSLDSAMARSFSPILLERRHQWCRCFRVRAVQAKSNNQWEALPDYTLPPGSKGVNDVRAVSLEAPGEQDLVIDNGLSLAHWAGLLADPALLRLSCDKLHVNLMDYESSKGGSSAGAVPQMTSCLKYSPAHYAAYAAASGVVEAILQWRAPATDIEEKPPEGKDMLDFQVPCSSHPAGRPKSHQGNRPQRSLFAGILPRDNKDACRLDDLRRQQPLCTRCLAVYDKARYVAVVPTTPPCIRHMFYVKPTDRVKDFYRMVAAGTGLPSSSFSLEVVKVHGVTPQQVTGSDELLATNGCVFDERPTASAQGDTQYLPGNARRALRLYLLEGDLALWQFGVPERYTFIRLVTKADVVGVGESDHLIGMEGRRALDRGDQCQHCADNAKGLPALQQPPRAGHTLAPLPGRRWEDWADLANAANGEGGGGLSAYRRLFSPPTAGDTPLSLTSQFAHVMMAQYLVGERANVGLRNQEGLDPHDIAVALDLRVSKQADFVGEADGSVALGVDAQAEKDVEHRPAATASGQLFSGHVGLELDRDVDTHTARLVEQLNGHKAVRKKLVRFALRHFGKSACHLILFTFVVTALSIILTDHFVHYYCSHSLRTLVTTEEWHTASINWGGDGEKPVRMFREDLSATLELEDFHNWFEVPFRAKVLGDPRFEAVSDIPPHQGWDPRAPCAVAFSEANPRTSCRIHGQDVSDFQRCEAAMVNETYPALKGGTCWKDNPYELFHLVGSVRVVKREVQNNRCNWDRPRTPLSFIHSSFDDGYRLGMQGDWQCWGTQNTKTLEEGSASLQASTDWPWILGYADYSSKFSRESYSLNSGEFLDIHPWDEIGDTSYYDTQGPDDARVRRHVNGTTRCTNLTRLVDGLGGADMCSDTEIPWVWQATRFVVVFMVFYNPSVDRFVVGEVFFELFAQGAITAFSKWHTVRISMYQTQGDIWRGVLEVLFCLHLIFHLCEEINDFRCTVMQIVSRARKEAKNQDEEEEEDGDESSCKIQCCCHQYNWARVLKITLAELWHHLTSEWNLIDIGVIVLQVFTVYLQVTIWLLQTSLRSRTDLLDPNTPLFHDEFVPLAHAVATQQRLLGFTTMLAWVKFLKSVVKVPEYGSTVNAIINTIMHQKVLIFGAVFSWILFAFFMGLYISFGMTTWSFRSFAPALLTTFRIVLGDSTQFEELEEQHIVAGPILFLVVLVFGQLVLLNLIVCVLQEVYEEAIKSAERDWSREIVEMYQYDLINLPNQGSIFDMLSHFLKLKRCCWFMNLREKELKRSRVGPVPDIGKRSLVREVQDAGWVVVPQLEDAAKMDDMTEDKYTRRMFDKLSELQSQVSEGERQFDELRAIVLQNRSTAGAAAPAAT